MAEYAEQRRGTYAWMLGRFIVPASRLAELCEHLGGGAFPLSVIVDAGSDARTWFAQMQARLASASRVPLDDATIEALEVPLPPLLSRRDTYDAAIAQYAASATQSGFERLPSYMEIPRTQEWDGRLDGTMQALQRRNLGAKIRCGGETAEAFPSSADVAAFIAAAARAGVRFKATAGLHHPLPRIDEATGARMHGFLNLIAAAAQLPPNGSESELVRTLEDDSASQFFELHEPALQRARDRFVSYGSCSFLEPVADLIDLQLLRDGE